MNAEAEYQIDGKSFRAVATRRDLFFGNGIGVSIYAKDGSLWAKTNFNCHVEFDGFENCQSMNTEQLLVVAISKLKEDGHAFIERTFPHGINALFRLNGLEK